MQKSKLLHHISTEIIKKISVLIIDFEMLVGFVKLKHISFVSSKFCAFIENWKHPKWLNFSQFFY